MLTQRPMPRPRTMARHDDARGHRHRQEVLQEARQQPLDDEPEEHAEHAAEQAHRGRLQQVHGEHLPRRRAEAAQDRDGVELPADEHRHRARHAEPAEEQRDERHEAEIVA